MRVKKQVTVTVTKPEAKAMSEAIAANPLLDLSIDKQKSVGNYVELTVVYDSPSGIDNFSKSLLYLFAFNISRNK